VNRQALAWCEEANHRVHATTREVPADRFAREELMRLNGQPDYDASYVSHCLVAKDCMLAYRGNRYSAARTRGQECRHPRTAGYRFHPDLLSAGPDRRASAVDGQGGMVVE
jgi:hypothetical protein